MSLRLLRLRRLRRPGHRRRTGVAAALLLVPALLLTGAGPVAGAHASGPPPRAGNPYQDARLYVNPEWSARAASVPGGEAVAGEPTAVWVERSSAITGPDGPAGRTLGLVDHLDEAVAQDADLIQIVLHGLPNRSCHRLDADGELGPGEVDRYRTEFIDPVIELLADPAYASLEVMALVEPEALANLVVHTGSRPWTTYPCDQALATGDYLLGISYALDRLGELPNVYSYLDASHHGLMGWDDNFHPFADLLHTAATIDGTTVDDVHGIVVNAAGYGATHEPYFGIGDFVHGVSVRQSRWVDWNSYADELSYGQALRQELIGKGFGPDLGLVIDTSRNGWGGPGRPAGSPVTGDVNTYVDGSRIDRRTHTLQWCNQAGAGLGERPAASPGPAGVDAYAWIKPPGESDGSDGTGLPRDHGVLQDRQCEVTDRWGHPTQALPGSPHRGRWFPEHFAGLLANAHPPLD
ncbi:glycoside hydrolase family 6 protein [Streptomyces aidingensis]|uniref:Glucanase n=1 Tax=Streptomyces aidingensis TaxID=910347 RepID=A0A1I1S2F7_9ACTN|nr:glycoside hydrolase family 6 protein [Streptomyces aidingensis]SFD40784.1 cellulose 1,4-beta-cellobiosidase [Streptomyces aidingensis]